MDPDAFLDPDSNKENLPPTPTPSSPNQSNPDPIPAQSSKRKRKSKTKIRRKRRAVTRKPLADITPIFSNPVDSSSIQETTNAQLSPSSDSVSATTLVLVQQSSELSSVQETSASVSASLVQQTSADLPPSSSSRKRKAVDDNDSEPQASPNTKSLRMGFR